MTDPFEIDNATGGGGGFIAKDKFETWADAGVMVLCRILRIHDEELMSNGNKVYPVTADLVVFTDPPQVWRAERLIQAGFVRPLRTKVETVNGKDVEVPRERNQVVAGHFGSYTAKKSGNKAFAINPATATELSTLKDLARRHGDLWDHYEAQALALAATRFAAEPEIEAATEALKSNDQAGEPVSASSGGRSDSDLPF